MKTLTEYLTNVANSIRKKKQTNELRNEISRIGVFSRLYKKII